MKHEERDILQACHIRQRTIQNEPEPPAWNRWARWEWIDRQQHGPEYKPTEWFGDMPNAMRVRYRRAIESLEKSGHVEAWRGPDGKRLSRIKLTIAGLQAASQLGGGHDIKTKTD